MKNKYIDALFAMDKRVIIVSSLIRRLPPEVIAGLAGLHAPRLASIAPVKQRVQVLDHVDPMELLLRALWQDATDVTIEDKTPYYRKFEKKRKVK